jgi:hypothetical protein
VRALRSRAARAAHPACARPRSGCAHIAWGRRPLARGRPILGGLGSRARRVRDGISKC